MPKLRVHNFSISLDGYAAGPDQSLDNPLGVGGTRLHEWAFATRSGRATHGMEGGAAGVHDDFVAQGDTGVGATIMGRNMFGPIRGTSGSAAASPPSSSTSAPASSTSCTWRSCRCCSGPASGCSTTSTVPPATSPSSSPAHPPSHTSASLGRTSRPRPLRGRGHLDRGDTPPTKRKQSVACHAKQWLRHTWRVFAGAITNKSCRA
jgi:hypothetical protein